MSCQAYRRWFSAYLDGVLDEPRRRELEQHLRDCPRCVQELESLKTMVTSLKRLGEVEAPRDLLDRVKATLVDTSSRRATARRPVVFPQHGLALAMTVILALLVVVPICLRSSAPRMPPTSRATPAAPEALTSVSRGSHERMADKQARASEKMTGRRFGLQPLREQAPAPTEPQAASPRVASKGESAESRALQDRWQQGAASEFRAKRFDAETEATRAGQYQLEKDSIIHGVRTEQPPIPASSSAIDVSGAFLSKDLMRDLPLATSEPSRGLSVAEGIEKSKPTAPALAAQASVNGQRLSADKTSGHFAAGVAQPSVDETRVTPSLALTGTPRADVAPQPQSRSVRWIVADRSAATKQLGDWLAGISGATLAVEADHVIVRLPQDRYQGLLSELAKHGQIAENRRDVAVAGIVIPHQATARPEATARLDAIETEEAKKAPADDEGMVTVEIVLVGHAE